MCPPASDVRSDATERLGQPNYWPLRRNRACGDCRFRRLAGNSGDVDVCAGCGCWSVKARVSDWERQSPGRLGERRCWASLMMVVFGRLVRSMATGTSPLIGWGVLVSLVIVRALPRRTERLGQPNYCRCAETADGSGRREPAGRLRRNCGACILANRVSIQLDSGEI